jgi:sRNA-binding carbon storage regulator CsrA
MKAKSDRPPNIGSLTLTLRDGEELSINTPTGDTLIVHCTKTQNGRTCLNIKAPREYQIRRQGVGVHRSGLG